MPRLTEQEQQEIIRYIEADLVCLRDSVARPPPAKTGRLHPGKLRCILSATPDSIMQIPAGEDERWFAVIAVAMGTENAPLGLHSEMVGYMVSNRSRFGNGSVGFTMNSIGFDVFREQWPEDVRAGDPSPS